MSEIVYRPFTPEYAEGCERLERIAFPTADPAVLLTAAEAIHIWEKFPEGFFIALDGDRVVGQGSGYRVNFDFEHPQHTVMEAADMIAPDGEWYYGIDIAVDPGYRKRGIGSELYRLRKQVVLDLGLKGIIAGGYLANYGDYKHEMSAAEYCDKVVAGELYDRTLTFQLQNGFTVRGVLEGYLTDEQNDGWASLIVWENPEAAE